MAIGAIVYQRRLVASGKPVRLAPRPVFLAGREGLLAELSARLTGKPGQAGPQLVALCGLGGAGKTSVAVEYAHRHLAEVGMCWQFPAEDPALLEDEFARLAAQLGARDVVDARDPVASVHAELARAGAGWLLVFDNAVDRESVERFVPPAGNGQVLVTTQSQHWHPRQALNVPVLETDVAADFLVSRAGEADRASAQELAAELGGLPLALEQAAAYMQATGTTLARYLPLFRDRQADLLTRGEAAGHPADMATTIGLAMSQLAGQAPVAAGLLRLLAFLAPEPVPLNLLLARGQAAGALGQEAASAIGPLLGDPIAVGDAIAALRLYSLVSMAGDGLVLVHRIVQAIIRTQLTAEEATLWEQAASILVETAIPSHTGRHETWPTCAALLPHVSAVLEPTSDGMRRIARYLGASNRYMAARDLCRQIVDALQESDAYGPEHPDTLIARHNLAYWTGLTRDWVGSCEQFTALLRVEEQILGPEHPSTLISRFELARSTAGTGDFARARDQFAALLPVHERVLGPEHPGTLATRHNLANWTGFAGNAVGARDQLAALLPVLETILGPEYHETLIAEAHLEVWAHRTEDAPLASG